jgi:hypothetical protein
MKTITLWLLLFVSHSYATLGVEVLDLKEHSEDQWVLRVSISNSGDDTVILNTGYLQHSSDSEDQEKIGQFYLLTENKGTSVNNVSYKHVPSIDEMKLVTLTKNQYCIITYRFSPDEDDKKMLSNIKNGKNYVVVYSSKDRGFSYSYWKGKIKSSNHIELRKL